MATHRIQEPIAPYVADADCKEAKLFANGRSQAIRLPKEFRMPGDRVRIHREGKRLIVEPIEEVEVDANGWPVDLWERIDAMGGAEDFVDIEPMPVKLLDPEEIEPLDDEEAARRGLP